MHHPEILEWLHMTTGEIDALDRKIPAVLPFGSIEAHGHHLPVGIDLFVSEAIARKACHETGAILLPGLSYTFLSGSTKNFVGSLDASAEITIAILKSLIKAVFRGGFKKIIILNGHGANRYLLEIAIRTILDTYEKKGLKLQYRSWWDGIREVHHACEVETSVAVAALGENVLRRDKISDHINQYKSWRSNDWAHESPKTGGVNGHPTNYSIEEGRRVLEQSIKNLVALLNDARENW